MLMKSTAGLNFTNMWLLGAQVPKVQKDTDDLSQLSVYFVL
jgi:hypothetical protein